MTRPDPLPESDPESPSLFRRLVRGLVYGVITLVALMVLAIAFVDLEFLRTPIASALSRSTGLKVDIGGLGLDWSGGLGLRAEGISVLSPAGDRALFSSEALFLKVRWVPLLEGRYEILEAELLKPVVQVFARHPAAVNAENVATLAEPAPPISPQSGLTSLRNLLVGMHLSAQRVRVREALVLWMPPEESPAEPLQIQTSFEVWVHHPDSRHLGVDIRELTVSAGEIFLSGEISARDILGPGALVEARIAGEPMDLAALETLVAYLPGPLQQKWKLVQPTGQLKTFALNVQVPGRVLFEKPVPEPDDLLGQGHFQIRNLVLQPPSDRPDLRLGLSGLQVKWDWAQGRLVHEAEAEFGNVPFQMKGALQIHGEKKDAMLLDTVLTLPAVSTQLLNSWLPPEWKLDQGELAAEMKVRGNLNMPESLEAEGAITGTGWRVISQKDRHLQVPLKQVAARFQWKDHRVRWAPVNLAPPHGRIKGQGEYRPGDRTYNVEYTAEGLRIEDFYRQNVNGEFNARGRLSGRLPKQGPALRGISGAMHLMAQKGRFYQLEPLRALLAVLNPLSVAQLGKKGLPYHTLGGDFDIKSGTVFTQNLSLISPDMKIYLAGNADPVEDRVNLRGRFQPSQDLDRAVSAIPILGEILKGGKQGGVIETRFTLQGSLRRPRVVFDAQDTLFRKGADMLKELGKVPQKVKP